MSAVAGGARAPPPSRAGVGRSHIRDPLSKKNTFEAASLHRGAALYRQPGTRNKSYAATASMSKCRGGRRREHEHGVGAESIRELAPDAARERCGHGEAGGARTGVDERQIEPVREQLREEQREGTKPPKVTK